MRDALDRIKTGGRRPAHIQIAVRPKREVIRGNRRLQCGEYIDLPRTADLEDRSTAVAHVEVLFVIECKAGRNAHPLRVYGHISVRRYLVDDAIVAAGDIEYAFAIEGNSRGIHDIGDKRLQVVIRIQAVHRYWRFLAA